MTRPNAAAPAPAKRDESQSLRLPNGNAKSDALALSLALSVSDLLQWCSIRQSWEALEGLWLLVANFQVLPAQIPAFSRKESPVKRGKTNSGSPAVQPHFKCLRKPASEAC